MCSGLGVGGAFAPDSLDEMQVGIDHLKAEELGPVSASTLVRMRTQMNQLEAEYMRRLARFDADQGFAETCLSTQAWLRGHSHLSPGAAADRVHTARRLGALPMTSGALADGAISYSHASLIAHTASEVGDKWDANAEIILVNAAKELDPLTLRQVCEHLKHALDPDGSLAEANENCEKRRLHLSHLNGMFKLDGLMDSEGGAALRTALNALMSPPAADDNRTAAQRRHDALIELARQALDHGHLPQVGGDRPHISLKVSMPTLMKQPGSQAADLEWGQPVPAETARRIACDAGVTTILLNEDDNPLYAFKTARLVNGPLRRAIAARDGGCRFPMCDRPVDWTDAHHIQHWADEGPTTIDNLVLLCRRHHRQVHEGGWQLSWGEKRDLVAIPP